MNKLSMCTPGPCYFNRGDPHNGRPCVRAKPLGVVVAVIPDTGPARGHEEPNAQLYALAYDHALLLAAIGANKAVFLWDRNVACVDEPPASRKHHTKHKYDLTPFGTPALTPELRAALERALGITREGGKA